MAGRKENESVSQFVSLFVCFSKTKDLASLKRTRLSINHDIYIPNNEFSILAANLHQIGRK